MNALDYPHVLALWQQSDGVGLGESDSAEAVAAFLMRNPGLSAVAEAGSGEIVGAVLCGHDGRRGYLHHLAVSEPHRRQGIGRQLIRHCLVGLARERISKCNIFVFREKSASISFWAHNGWVAPAWQVMQKRVDA